MHTNYISMSSMLKILTTHDSGWPMTEVLQVYICPKDKDDIENINQGINSLSIDAPRSN